MEEGVWGTRALGSGVGERKWTVGGRRHSPRHSPRHTPAQPGTRTFDWLAEVFLAQRHVLIEALVILGRVYAAAEERAEAGERVLAMPVAELGHAIGRLALELNVLFARERVLGHATPRAPVVPCVPARRARRLVALAEAADWLHPRRARHLEVASRTGLGLAGAIDLVEEARGAARVERNNAIPTYLHVAVVPVEHLGDLFSTRRCGHFKGFAGRNALEVGLTVLGAFVRIALELALIEAAEQLAVLAAAIPRVVVTGRGCLGGGWGAAGRGGAGYDGYE